MHYLRRFMLPYFTLKLLINSKHCWLMKQNKSRPRKSLHMKLSSSFLINLLAILICKDSLLLFKRISCRYSFGPTVKFKPENIDERWFKFPFIAEISRILIEYSKQIIFKSLPDLQFRSNVSLSILLEAIYSKNCLSTRECKTANI